LVKAFDLAVLHTSAPAFVSNIKAIERMKVYGG